MKYTPDGINIKLDTTEKKVNEFKDTGKENIQNETQREKRLNKK